MYIITHIYIFSNIFHKKLIKYVLLGRLLSNNFLTAREVGVNLKNGYNGDISSRDAGKIGGNMVRKLIQKAENQMIGK